MARARHLSPPSQLNLPSFNLDPTLRHPPLETAGACREVILACDGMIGAALLGYRAMKVVHQILLPSAVRRPMPSQARSMFPLVMGSSITLLLNILLILFPENVYMLAYRRRCGCLLRPHIPLPLRYTILYITFPICHNQPCQILVNHRNPHMAIHLRPPLQPQLIRNLSYSRISSLKSYLAVMAHHLRVRVPLRRPDCPGPQI